MITSRHRSALGPLLLGALALACQGGKGRTPGETGEISLALKAPESFTRPFCVALEVAGPDFSPPIRTEASYPANTLVIETVTPNIPVGAGRTVELGIFKDANCKQPFSAADWSGRAEEVVIERGRVTLVEMTLTHRGAQGNTGSVVVRGSGQFRRRLHGEVVDRESTPIAQAVCRIYEGEAQVGVVASGVAAPALGVIDTEVTVSPMTAELRLECEHASYAKAIRVARLIPDPADPARGTFTATVVMQPRVEVLVSSAERLTFRVHVPSLAFESVATAAGEFQRLARLDGAVAVRHGVEMISLPETPVLGTFVALPIGGGADVTVTPEGDPVSTATRLYPIQRPIRAAAGANPGDPFPPDQDGFDYDPDVYARGGTNVRKPAAFGPIGGGDANVHELKLHLADYEGGTLTRYPSLLVDIKFTGGTCFKPVRLAPQLDMDQVDRGIEAIPPIAERPVINAAILNRFTCPVVIRPIFLGARLVIVAPPDLLPAAEDLRSHKVARGISTMVVSTATISGGGALSDVALRDWLLAAYGGWLVRPRWVLLLGDAEHIPTHYDPAKNIWDNARNAGDQFYGQLGGATSLPVFGIGRIPADTLAQAQVVVNKIKAFETSPPAGIANPFYSRQTYAAQFQDDNLDGRDERWFAETSEHIRDYQISLGMTVERIYRAPAASNPTFWQGGAPVPWYLRKPTFPWNGSTADVINAVNGGTSLLYHRNHGWWWGWGTPSFSTGDLASVSVTGNRFPVVFSINCASGIFDNETVDLPANKVGSGYGPSVAGVYWAEDFLRRADGALAVVGDTRSSSTILNNDMAKGLFDAIFPGYLPYGSGTAIKALGDVVNAAKGYLISRGYGLTDLKQQMVIYNLLGDPTVQVRTRPPIGLVLSVELVSPRLLEVRVGPEPCKLCPELPPMTELVLVALGEKGEVLGRAVPSANGTARIDVGDHRGRVRLVASGGDFHPAQAEVAVQ